MELPEKETKLICCGALKGGVGKTTITSGLANEMADKNLDFLVVDCDLDQQSLYDQYIQDESLIGEGDLKIKKMPYEVMAVASYDFPKVYSEQLYGNYDYILIDLPGSFQQKGVLECYLLVDVLFILTHYNPIELRSFSDYLKRYFQKISNPRKENGYNTTIYGMLNRVMKNFSGFKEFEEIKGNMPIPFLDHFVPYREAVFGREFSTLRPYVNTSGEREFDVIFDEMIEKIMNHV